MRIILYTGKGGVGKTTIAAATACKIASMGKDVLVISTDQAHSLGDSFDKTLSNEPIKLKEHLYALEIDTVTETEKAWGELKDYLKRLLASQSNNEIETEELLVFPGFEELFSLLKIKEIYQEGRYDVLIVDCAPTGETMSLLKFPEMLGWWIEHLFPLKRKAIRVVGSTIEKATKIPMPKEENFLEIENLYEKTIALQELLSKKDVVSIRIVTTPESIVVREAKRNFSYLHLFDYNIDAIIVNKIYPKLSLSGYFSKWIQNQERSLQDIKESFFDIPIFEMELNKSELRAIEKLEIAADILYRETDPTNVLFQDTIFTIEKKEKGYLFCIFLPFVQKEEMDLLQKGDELTIAIQNERRSFILPNKLKNKEIQNAEYKEGKLKLYFVQS